MRLGVILADDSWRFFEDIYQDFLRRYQVSVFNRRRVRAPFFYSRINQAVFNHDLESFLKNQDVVFFEWASEMLVAASRLAKTTRIVARMHRYEMFQLAGQVNWDNVDRVILVSEAMRQKFVQRFPAHAHKATVIYESVDIHRFTPVEKPFQGDIGTLCFPVPRKRVYELILAYYTLQKKNPEFRLHIGGDNEKTSDYKDALHSLVKKLNLDGKVIFYGGIRDPWNWYQHIDIFISNSYSEGLQVAPMEAMASGRYTLSHHWDGADELLPDENLFLTEAELVEKIEAYAGLPETEQQQLQARMRSIACQRFNSELIQAQVRAVVEQLAQEGTR